MYCPGQYKEKKHQGNFYKCKGCGATGCKQKGCSKQNFDGYKCMSCGQHKGQKIL